MPSEKVLAAKKAEVESIVEALKGAATGVLVDYRGLALRSNGKTQPSL